MPDQHKLYSKNLVHIIRMCHQFLQQTQASWKNWVGYKFIKRSLLKKALFKTVSQLPNVKKLTVFFYPDNVIHLIYEQYNSKIFEITISLSHCIYTNTSHHKIIGYKYTDRFWTELIWNLSKYIILDLF